MKIEVPLHNKSLKELVRGRYERWRNNTKESKIYLCTLFALSEGICPACSTKMILSFDGKYNRHPLLATLDHTIPLSKILEHKKYGLEIMCFQCNQKKADN